MPYFESDANGDFCDLALTTLMYPGHVRYEDTTKLEFEINRPETIHPPGPGSALTFRPSLHQYRTSQSSRLSARAGLAGSCADASALRSSPAQNSH